jgi:hypothetical protein
MEAAQALEGKFSAEGLASMAGEEVCLTGPLGACQFQHLFAQFQVDVDERATELLRHRL